MKTCIKALAYYLPETVVTNEQLVEEFPEWTVEKIAAKVGVNQRHIARDETISDMAVKAAEKMFVDYPEVNKEEVPITSFRVRPASFSSVSV